MASDVDAAVKATRYLAIAMVCACCATLRSNRQAPGAGQKDLAGDPPSVSYQADAAAASRTAEQLAPLPETSPITFAPPAVYVPWMSQNAKIASLEDEKALSRISMIDHNAKGAGAKYCWNAGSDGGGPCDHDKRLADVVFIKRRRTRLRGYRWQAMGLNDERHNDRGEVVCGKGRSSRQIRAGIRGVLASSLFV